MTSQVSRIAQEIFIRVAAQEACVKQTKTWEDLTKQCFNAAIEFQEHRQTVTKEENNADYN